MSRYVFVIYVHLHSFLDTMEKIQMVDLQGQYGRLREEMDASLREVMRSARFVRGPEVHAFEEELASYVGTPHVITCASGTDALQLAFMALGLQPGDEVVTVPFTFVSTVEVIALLGLTPVFVDVNPDTFCMDVTQLESVLTPRTRAVLPVHLFGHCVDMEPLLAFARKHGLFVVEDACQAIGAEVVFADGTRHQAGTMGDIGCTSFFPSKNLGCYGDGGALFVRDEALADMVRVMANHGMRERYRYESVGLNSRLDTLQAAVLRVKLHHLDEFTSARRRAATEYTSALEHHPAFVTPVIAPYSSHVFHQYTLKLNGIPRQSLMEELAAVGIPTAVYYPQPLHLQKAYEYLGYKAGDFPASENLAQCVLSLPMHTELSREQIQYIVQNLVQNI